MNNEVLISYANFYGKIFAFYGSYHRKFNKKPNISFAEIFCKFDKFRIFQNLDQDGNICFFRGFFEVIYIFFSKLTNFSWLADFIVPLINKRSRHVEPSDILYSTDATSNCVSHIKSILNSFYLLGNFKFSFFIGRKV
jgi:hypothetical protein